MSELAECCEETRAWLETSCSDVVRGPDPLMIGSTKIPITYLEVRSWLDATSEQGWTVPMLPTEYAGAVLSEVDGLVLIRALQHERSDMIALAVVAQCPCGPMQSEMAKRYVGEAYGKVADKGLRQKLLRQEMTARSLQSIQRRTFEESAEAQTLRCKILMCEYYSSIATQNSIEFGPDILIYSDSNEIQFYTIAKRVLGLSD